MSYDITQAVKITNASPNVDWYYGGDSGAWASLAAAKTGVPEIVRMIGKTVLVNVAASGETPVYKEYWWRDGTTDNDLVEKSGGGNAELQVAMTITKSLGGITASVAQPKVYAVGTALETILNDLLCEVVTPTYVEPSVSMTQYTTTVYAIGATVPSRVITVTYDAGAINLDGVKQNDRGGAATLYNIYTSGADTNPNVQDASSGALTMPSFTRASKGTVIVTGAVTYAQGAQPKDSSGANYGQPLSGGTKTTTQTLKFVKPFYTGVASTTPTSTSGLTPLVEDKGNKTVTYTQNNQIAVFAYDSAYGNLSKIIEQSTGYDVISGWVNVPTISGYNTYIQQYKQTTSPTATYTFQF